MLVRWKHSDDSTVFAYKPPNSIVHRCIRFLKRNKIRILEQCSKKHCGIGLTDPRADLLRNPCKMIDDADILNFHKTQHFVDIPSLFLSLPCSKPIVITLHDLSSLTGGCDYPGSCDHYTKECGECPILGSENIRDYSNRNFNIRKRSYLSCQKDKLVFASNSNWTLQMAKKSGLCTGFKHSLQPLCIDQKIFCPEDRKSARTALGILSKERTICFAAHDLNNPYKGLKYLIEALRIVGHQQNFTLLSVGKGNIDKICNYRHIHFGKTESDHMLSLIYRAADVFVIPSIEESFGQTALEASACGTLIAGFCTGGIPDIVEHGCNGYLAKKGDTNDLSRAILMALQNTNMQKDWQIKCKPSIYKKFSYKRSAETYISLYKSIL